MGWLSAGYFTVMRGTPGVVFVCFFAVYFEKCCLVAWTLACHSRLEKKFPNGGRNCRNSDWVMAPSVGFAHAIPDWSQAVKMNLFSISFGMILTSFQRLAFSSIRCKKVKFSHIRRTGVKWEMCMLEATWDSWIQIQTFVSAAGLSKFYPLRQCQMLGGCLIFPAFLFSCSAFFKFSMSLVVRFYTFWFVFAEFSSWNFSLIILTFSWAN